MKGFGAVRRTAEIVFPPFRLDPVNEQLWRDHQLVPLRPKAFAVLRCLVEQAGRLVTKEDLLKAVWPGTRVNEGLLKGYIRDLRDLLGDDPYHPCFIETVPRRGHRFVAAVTTTAPVSSAEFQVSNPPRTANTQHPASLLVGREAELTHLHRLFTNAMRGERQVVFVTGEPGIGKTTLVETFLFGAQSDEQFEVQKANSRTPNSELPSLHPWIGRGQCVEQHGAGEPYLPVLEALGRIGRSPDGEQLVTILRQAAPTWLVQMPALLTAEELATLQRQVAGATRERMLREMVEAIEVLTVQHPLVLWFEDLHWADASTVDWLAAVAQQAVSARLLVIGTYRPSDLSLRNHPLRAVKQELVAKGQCEELLLPFLSADDVTRYLTQRYTAHHFPPELGAAIHRRTDGNPLFVVNMVEYLAAQGVIAEVNGHWRLQSPVAEVARGVPDSLRQLIEKHIERLSEEDQRLLEVASVVGVTFAAASVAAGLQIEAEAVDQQCETLARTGHFLRSQGIEEWPDGTVGGQYSFLHALYQQGLYERVTEARRVRIHRRIGEQKATAYGERAREIASELAVHFEAGREYPKAVQYHRQAGEAVARHNAHQEALSHLKRGLEILTLLPDSPERMQHEVRLQLALANPLYAIGGRTSLQEMEHAYLRAQELCQRMGEPPQLASVLFGLCMVNELRGEVQKGLVLAEQLLTLAQKVQNPGLLLRSHMALGNVLYFIGDFTAARRHLEQALTIYDPDKHSPRVSNIAQDVGVVCLSRAGWVLWCLGYPEQARRSCDKGLTLARKLSHLLSEAFALDGAIGVAQECGELPVVERYVERMISLSQEQGFPYCLLWGKMVRGWLLTVQGNGAEGIAQLRQGIDGIRMGGQELGLLYFMGLLAEAYGIENQAEEGLTVVAEALEIAAQRGERFYEAELYRLRGELTLAQSSIQSLGSRVQINQKAKSRRQKAKITSPLPLALNTQREVEQEAEGYFLKAINIARRQQAKSLELRAVLSLVRLRQQQATHAPRNTQHVSRNRLGEAHRLLSEIYHWFAEGFDTKDLQDAKALLEELRD